MQEVESPGRTQRCHLVLWIPCIGLLVGFHFGDVPWPWPQRGRKEKSKEALRVELVSGVQPNT